MTREEYECKVQSMPQSLQQVLRESLEISLSRRIVNRFMSVVMQAYSHGQRAAILDNAGYEKGAKDMLNALKTVTEMGPDEIYKYFGAECRDMPYGLCAVLHGCNPDEVIEIINKYRDEKEEAKKEREKAQLKIMADVIGLERMSEIVKEMQEAKNDAGAAV